ncbi:MAG: cytochrome c oxidase assembly protein [Sterolibacteriaceae bacterium]|uniref:Cytochrome c oxidase assembly protein CtaG n=1 Tax=Candidatus Methylophosphatis roskildensis TaxID=2899263 RepID=A0A9D7HKZ0_9PROT|nr:cytochrome c oxidase assembly protein [Candidatus Methylophosphatis roskildensis]
MRTTAPDNRKMLLKLAVIALGMFGFGFALVPFYEKICQVAGINNLLQPDTVTNTQVDLSRSVIIEFDANTHDMPWRFRPLEASVTVHPGELKTISYEVVNTRDRPVSGQAIPSYGPQHAAQYFRKMECFCFNKQTLAAGERRQMPVTFVVDPALPADVGTITLSYTFFEVEGSAGTPPRAPASQGRTS